MKNRVAVVLFNLGGPSSLGEVRGFLFNLFNDKAIIDQPRCFRFILAKIISFFREKKASKIYESIGGSSPILPLTKEQAKALEQELVTEQGRKAKVFIAMRYSSPRAKEVVMQIASGDFDEVVLLPLYPQFSTTTTGSSVEEFMQLAKGKISAKIKTICCYPEEELFVRAHAQQIEEELKKVPNLRNLRILFSAHGLPEKVIEKGDPYQFQIEKTVDSVSRLLPAEIEKVICYQSRVGPVKWIGPSTESEIERAAAEGMDIMIVPIAFVSEHSETLVELDIQYKQMAQGLGIEGFYRVKALGKNSLYIKSLARMVDSALKQKSGIFSSTGTRICPEEFCKCLMEKKNDYR